MASADPLTILARYAAGFFPLYDLLGRFYWERLSVRAVIPITPESLAAAKKLARRSRSRFVLRRTHDVPAVLGHLRDESVKPRTWVRGEVVAIYRALHAAGLLSTVEAYDAATGQLAGALLGIVLPGTFIAETMFSLASDASKVCLCRLIEDAHAGGQQLIDVQTPHHLDERGLPRTLTGHSPHPCMRLGEEHWAIARFLRVFRTAWKEQFPGDVSDWLAASESLTRQSGGLPCTPLSATTSTAAPSGLSTVLYEAASRLRAPHFGAETAVFSPVVPASPRAPGDGEDP